MKKVGRGLGLLDIKQLAVTLDVSARTVYRLKALGKLPKPFLTHGAKCYWTRQQVRDWQSGTLNGTLPNSATTED